MQRLPYKGRPGLWALAPGSLPRRGEGCLPSPQGKRVAVAAPVFPGGVSRGCPHPQVRMHGGDEGEQLLFAMCRRLFVKGHGDFGPCRFWAVSEGCGALAGSVTHLSPHSHLCQLLSAGRMLKHKADTDFADKQLKSPLAEMLTQGCNLACTSAAGSYGTPWGDRYPAVRPPPRSSCKITWGLPSSPGVRTNSCINAHLPQNTPRQFSCIETSAFQ